jgi:hypothetical protein
MRTFGTAASFYNVANWLVLESTLRLGKRESRGSQIKATGIGRLRNAIGIATPVHATTSSEH